MKPSRDPKLPTVCHCYRSSVQWSRYFNTASRAQCHQNVTERGILSPAARVVELVDTGDLKSPAYCKRAGSSPAPGTTFNPLFTDYFFMRRPR